MPTPAVSEQRDTFIREKRRQQLIDATIAVIVDSGVSRATFVAIAAHAGVSRGVINYHFADRAALLDAVVGHVYELGQDIVGGPVEASVSAAGSLSAMIVGSIDFYAAHTREMTALSSIFASAEFDASDRANRAEHSTEMTKFEIIFRRGQKAGEFRDFDPTVMAMSVRATLDAALRQITAGADPEEISTEIDQLFAAATRSERR